MHSVGTPSGAPDGQAGITGGVFDQSLVGGQENEAFGRRHGEQQTIEGIAVRDPQGRGSQCVFVGDGKDERTRFPHRVAENAGGTGSFPIWCLIATSQMLATETTHREPVIRSRVTLASRRLAVSHQSATWVSRRSVTGGLRAPGEPLRRPLE